MKTRTTLPVICSAGLMALGGCSSTDTAGYPSLAIRDVERVQGSAMPAAPTPDSRPLPPLSADVREKLAQLRQRAESAHQRFMAFLPVAQRRVNAAGGASIGSEAWAVATVTLAELDTSRNPGAVALADLDSLYVQAEMEAGDLVEITAARDAVLALTRAQETELARLSQTMR